MRTGLPQPVGRSADVLFGGVQRTRLDVAGPSQTHEQQTNMEDTQNKPNEAQSDQLRQADVVSRAIQDLFAQGRISLVVDGDKYYNRVSISVYIDEKQVYWYDGVLY